MWIIVVNGHCLMRGLRFYGPFRDRSAAEKWANEFRLPKGVWQTIKLEQPR